MLMDGEVGHHEYAECWDALDDEEAVEMQVLCGGNTRLGAQWHRLLPNQQETACEIVVNVRTSSFERGDVLVEPLCFQCFTPRERRFAQETITQRHKAITAEQERADKARMEREAATKLELDAMRRGRAKKDGE